MLRLFIFISLCLLTCLGLASQALDQIDVIVFTHPQTSAPAIENTVASLLAPDSQKAIQLQEKGSHKGLPYQRLPTSSSALNHEFWALHHQSHYQVLLHETWLQPRNRQRPVALNQTSSTGWTIEGIFDIKRSNYYLLDTQLLLSSPNQAQPAFVLSQKQRLKPGVVYYLDHPQAGILIKIHQVA